MRSDMAKSREELMEARKQMLAEMEQKLHESWSSKEDSLFFEIPRPLYLKGLHLSLYSLSSGEGKIENFERPSFSKFW